MMSASPTRHDEGEQTTHAYGPIDDLDLKATVARSLRFMGAELVPEHAPLRSARALVPSSS